MAVIVDLLTVDAGGALFIGQIEQLTFSTNHTISLLIWKRNFDWALHRGYLGISGYQPLLIEGFAIDAVYPVIIGD